MNLLFDKTHIKKNILTGEQVLVSPHRIKRFWQVKVEESKVVNQTNEVSSW